MFFSLFILISGIAWGYFLLGGRKGITELKKTWKQWDGV